MKSSAGTKQNASFKTKTKKSSFRNTRKTKWTRRAKERLKQIDKYNTSAMNPEWDENLHKITKLPNGKDNTSASSVVLKKVGRKGNIARPIVENETIGEIQGYEDVNDPIKDTVFSCNLCQKMFTSSLGLNRHKQVHRAKDYGCKICGKMFRRQSSLHKHSVLHSDDSPYKCPVCGKYSKSKERYTLHLRTHSGDKPYQCDICRRNFTQIGNLKLHKKNIHAPESVFKCEICCIEFEYNKELISHVLTHTDGKILKCYECGKMFGKKEHFEKHQELHTEVRPFSCDICGNTYKKNADLKCHLETHDTSQGYVCDVCGRSFGYKSSLKYHLRIHTGDKPYNCDICGKAFRTSSNRSKHVLSHTNYRPFSCDQCAKSFRDNRSLVIHKRTHSGNRPYQCSICFKSFIVQSELNRHRKKLHLNAMECDNENGRTISTKRLSPYSKGTKYDQRERSVENTYDEMARDSVQNDVTKGRNHENLTHVEAASLGVDHMQLFPKESTTVSLPEIPIVNSSHASITTSIEKSNIQPIDDVSNTVVEMTNSCQYEMAVHYSSNDMYGYVRDMLLIGNEMGSRGRNSAPSPYILPATSLCPADTSSTWINNLESNNSGVNSSQQTTQPHTNTTFFQRDREHVMEPIMQLPNSLISAHYGRSNISQCGDVNQTEHTLQQTETPFTAPHKETFILRANAKSESMENSSKLKSESTVDESVSKIIKDNDNAEEGPGNYVISDRRGSIQKSSPDRRGSIQESSRYEGYGRNTHDNSPGSCVTKCLSESELVVLSGVPGMNANESSFDREESTSDVSLSGVEHVTTHNGYSTSGDSDRVIGDFEIDRDIGANYKGNGKGKVHDPQEKLSVRLCANTESLQTPTEAIHNDKVTCQESGSVVNIMERSKKCPRNTCLKSVRKRKQKTGDNSKMTACYHRDQSLSDSISPNSHKKIYKNMSDVHDSEIPWDTNETSAVSNRGFVLQTKHNELKTDKITEFVCIMCNKQEHSQHKLQQHMMTKHSSDVSNTEFRCQTCSKIYPSKLSLQGHVRIHNSKEHACPVCHRKFHRPAYLKRHMLIHTDENPYRCPYCSKDFVCKNFLKPHLRTHTGTKPYQCDVCGMRFTQQAQLMSHKRQHAPEKAFRCDDCGVEFVDNQDLLVHITAHGREANKCKDCGKVFGRLKHLQKHMEIHNRDRRRHQCKYCDDTFLNKNDCRIHESIHTDDMAFSCEYCGKQFRHKSGLNYHIRTHTGEKPYPCKICGKSFRTNSYLHKHTMFHTGFRPYKCDKCGKGFTCKNDLVIHMRTHTGERPFTCSICEKTFREMTTMKKHVLSIHTCSTCGKTFRERSDLGMHVMSHQSTNTCSQQV